MRKGEETAGAKALPRIFGKWKQMDRGMVTDLEAGNYKLKYVQGIPKRSESSFTAQDLKL